jgi:hypothetical protein
MFQKLFFLNFRICQLGFDSNKTINRRFFQKIKVENVAKKTTFVHFETLNLF